ncbi:hypothetical protein, partial [Pseudomonas sp. GW460-13]
FSSWDSRISPDLEVFFRVSLAIELPPILRLLRSPARASSLATGVVSRTFSTVRLRPSGPFFTLCINLFS